MKHIIKDFLPPVLIRLLKREKSTKWSGSYTDWQDALIKCSGYSASNILEKVKESVLKVKSGEAAFERDSVLFDKIEYSWPLLSSLMWVAALNKGTLNVLDFGGSLGSSYFQNKKFLAPLDVNWYVVEQKSFVECGQKFIQDDCLKFFSSVDEIKKSGSAIDVVVIACTLPYLENPYNVLEDLINYEIPYLIVDNTPFNYQDSNRLTIQEVDPNIYSATYPCWLLNYEEVIQRIRKKYAVISEHENDLFIYVDGKRIQYSGFLAKLKSSEK